jgi:hypothetical protein
MLSRLRTLLSALWHRLPFPAMTVLVLVLYLVKEQFPFSNFPMYSRISEEADVVFITNEKDEAMAMKALFKTSSASTKKMYKKELATITNPKGRNSEFANADERREAGSLVLATLEKRLIAAAIPPDTRAIRLQIRTFAAGIPIEESPAPELLAEIKVP